MKLISTPGGNVQIQSNNFLDQSEQAFQQMQKSWCRILQLQAEHPGKIEIVHDQVIVAPELAEVVDRAMRGES